MREVRSAATGALGRGGREVGARAVRVDRWRPRSDVPREAASSAGRGRREERGPCGAAPGRCRHGSAGADHGGQGGWGRPRWTCGGPMGSGAARWRGVPPG